MVLEGRAKLCELERRLWPVGFSYSLSYWTSQNWNSFNNWIRTEIIPELEYVYNLYIRTEILLELELAVAYHITCNDYIDLRNTWR